LKRTWLTAWNTKSAKVISIEENVCRQEGFDIEMPDHHNFFANGMLVHNCHQVGYDDENSQAMQIITELKRRNPALRIIGYTGSPWRGTEPIKGKFWKHQLYKIDMWELVKLGFVDP